MAKSVNASDHSPGGSQFKSLSPLDVITCSGFFSFTCYSQRIEDKRIIRNSQFFCLPWVSNQIIYT